MQQLLPQSYLVRWGLLNMQKQNLQEIRIRSNKPLFLTYHGKEWKREDIIVEPLDVEQIFGWLCGYGVYAYQEEIAQGFITIQGGHRVGIGGQVLVGEDGRIKSMKNISSILIRVSHEVKGVAKSTLPRLYQNGCLCNTLILSPPGCGKTTFLRDLVRMVSDGTAYAEGQNVTLIDEREELAGMYGGCPTLEVGKRTDVITGCNKATAMEMCLRALGPQVVAVDEIYDKKDLRAVKRLYGSGIVILATHHADSIETFFQKPFGQKVKKTKIFTRIVLLGKEQGSYLVKQIYKDEEADA